MTSEDEGVLRKTQSGRWEIRRAGRMSLEITSGHLFQVEVNGQLALTRMEYSHGKNPGYYSVDGYKLRDGLRAAPANT